MEDELIEKVVKEISENHRKIIDDQLCPSCKDFDRVMNGGPTSSDIWVVCNHERECYE